MVTFMSPLQLSVKRVFSAVLTLMCVLLLVLITACSGGSEGAQEDNRDKQTVVDALGREVQVPEDVERVLMGGQKMLYTTALLNPDNPTDKIVAWPQDLLENDNATYDRYVEKFPEIADIPTIGEIYNNTMSLEQALETRPDVFIVNAGVFDAAEDAGIISGLEKAGVPTVAVDYFIDPMKNTVPSIRLMGELLDREEQAESYIRYYESKIQRVKERLDETNATPTPTFLWRAPGYFECCSTFADSNLGQIVEFAGGENLGTNMIDAKQGEVSPEAVAGKDPEVIIATGADWDQGKTPVSEGTYVPMGYGITGEQASAHLRAIVDKQPAVKEVNAVKNQRTFVAWHHFYDSPYNVVAVEMFAKAMHPDLFKDIDPEAEVKELHKQFLPVDAQGTFWAGLE